MSQFFNVLILLILAGIAMPFIWQVIKTQFRIVDKFALVCTIALQVLLAVFVLWWSGMLTLFNIAPAWFLIFLVAQFIYEKAVVKLWPEKRAV